ncbi:MAG: DUF86 domain-containing protein [Desulfomonile tiedjei]|uniref:DUF86 domain-containing protein n=1 Tax=Desulfomonile tiedjei TaxID=2358 RepID=A0A9D6V4Z1_9BACT|nr:DUF86 domain-containing protein [Desulfomonile tiedjei]
MRKDDQIRLRHMLDSAREAVHFAKGKTRGDLDGDRLLALGLMKCVEIIGEAAANISNECRETLPAIPWKSILGMRNRLVHTYFEIDLDVVWYTTTVSLPPLVQIREGILAQKSPD